MRFTRWDQSLSTEETNSVIHDFALWHCEQADGRQAVEIADHILGHDYKSLVGYQLNLEELTAHQLIHLRQALAFYAKRADLEIGVDKQQVAYEKFLQAEELCAQSNDIFRKWSEGRYRFRPFTELVFYRAATKIQTMLGDVPRLSDLKLQFGPGATTQVTKRMASYRAKLGHMPACSKELFPSANYALRQLPHLAVEHFGAELRRRQALPAEYPSVWCTPLPLHIHEGKVVFVPKSAKELRAVMVEPVLNTMCQAGIGRFLAERLRTVGIDIRDQTLNQRLAREGSITGALATLDLSSASDTISRELVQHLLGPDWFSFLSRFRTGSALLQGRVVELEKFSSMGNGFTFPLETLIFWALAKATCESLGLGKVVVSVYGDDIIVPSGAYAALCDVLRDSGFVVNTAKSYATGPFRESCGKDYFSGIDVRPVYIKDRMSGQDAFRLHNHYVRMFWSESANSLLSYLDPTIQLWGPDGYGDGHLISDEWPRRRKPKHLASGFGGSCFDTFTFKSVKSFRGSRGDRILPCYTVYSNHEFEADPEVRSNWIDRKSRAHKARGLSMPVAEIPISAYGYDKGELFHTLPGVEECKRISIYTFN